MSRMFWICLCKLGFSVFSDEHYHTSRDYRKASRESSALLFFNWYPRTVRKESLFYAEREKKLSFNGKEIQGYWASSWYNCTLHPLCLPTALSAQPHFDAQIGEIRSTPLPPQFDTTNLELVFYGSLEYITLPERNNNGDTSIKQAPCIHCVIKLISTWHSLSDSACQPEQNYMRALPSGAG